MRRSFTRSTSRLNEKHYQPMYSRESSQHIWKVAANAVTLFTVGCERMTRYRRAWTNCLLLACGAGASIKPGAQAPGTGNNGIFEPMKWATASVLQTGWLVLVARIRGLKYLLCSRTWGLRPRLYACACSAGEEGL